MLNPKPPYPAQFREQMVELVRAGRRPGELAKEFGCHVTSPVRCFEYQRTPRTRRTSSQAAPSPDGARHIGKGRPKFANNGDKTSIPSTR